MLRATVEVALIAAAPRNSREAKPEGASGLTVVGWQESRGPIEGTASPFAARGPRRSGREAPNRLGEQALAGRQAVSAAFRPWFATQARGGTLTAPPQKLTLH